MDSFPTGQLTRDYRPDPKVYIQLIKECESLGKEGEFSPCFTELQRAFLRDRPTKLKSLIRLVKHWYQECKSRNGKKRALPPQYALELLTVYAWERGSRSPEFNTAQGFRTVLELVLKHQDLCIYWEKYYSFETPIIGDYLKKQLGKPRPVILDPADPTGNVAGRDPSSWQLLAQEAAVCLGYPCFREWNGSPVSAWKVQCWYETQAPESSTPDTPGTRPHSGQLPTEERELKRTKVEATEMRVEASEMCCLRCLGPRLHQGAQCDVLPASHALGQLTRGYRPDPKVYIQLIKECESLGKEGEFSPCFTELQRAFLRDRPTKLKSLIRLVKHWYQECKRQRGKPLPPQYALELLTVYAWEQGSGKTEFNMAQGFRTVLELVLKHQDLCIYWEKYYSFETPIIGDYLKKQLGKPRPVILDPADPTGNIGGGDRHSWQRLAEEAAAWLSYPCLKKWDGSPVDSWHVLPRKDSYWTHEACDDGQHWEFSPRPITLQGGRPASEEENWTCVIL
nr:uncharacterized protein LOC102530627 [Vicugna pacos]